ncbi:helix-turn-helix transcriptional regulator [Martelella radicis]|uniref:DNA-binding CsgD family transcriptional regulator n=1 Tax=Martelella radicis TaxID=1397476 RepID=A0A7W6KJF2_9HYPH|nr:helix-turn-helix transcriptional regulator [Martelella radicis]MBB4122444.1 DNA-binding CsgD family transcriptional regulator [Martelella radicis]
MLSDTIDIERIYSLWDELADFEASRMSEARFHLLSVVCDMIDARQADWIGAVRFVDRMHRDPLFGWRPRSVSALYPDEETAKVIQEAFALMERGTPDITTVRNAELAGTFRVFMLHELAPAEWYEGEAYRIYYRGIDRLDSIWVGVPINEDAEIQIGFHRSLSQSPFSERDRRIVAHALRGIRWFFRLQMLSEGIGVASEPLTQAEGNVLQGLLKGLPERKIAEKNGQSPHTTHDHVKRIYRKYGVTSRPALMALWLGQTPPP